ncbi:MAG: glycosyltransferase family 4 protein [Chloroflexota bacterium]
MQIPLVLVGDYVALNPKTALFERPRQDYEEIVRFLGGELCCTNHHHTPFFSFVRRIDKRLKIDLLAAFLASQHISRYNSVLSTSEKLAIPLAMLSYFKRVPVPHVVIAHKLSSGLKTSLFRTWPLHHQFHHIISVCRPQAEYAVTRLGFTKEQVDFIYDKVDHLFFCPQNKPVDDYILAVGMEQRDYPTLTQALEDTDIRVVILAKSPWSSHQVRTETAANVTYVTKRLSYLELRDLYARARMVVIPLNNVDYAAGVNSVLEAMAMAKPLVVTRTAGIDDYLRADETGLFAAPHDSTHLREQILSLWHNQQQQQRLAANARQMVEEQMNLDIYVQNIVRITQGATAVFHKKRTAPNQLPIS